MREQAPIWGMHHNDIARRIKTLAYDVHRSPGFKQRSHAITLDAYR